MLRFSIQDIHNKMKNGTEVEESKTQDLVLLDSSERTALAKNLNGSLSKKALALVEALEGKVRFSLIHRVFFFPYSCYCLAC
jgi:hypothetical protein